jgi:hypothetical protein
MLGFYPTWPKSSEEGEQIVLLWGYCMACWIGDGELNHVLSHLTLTQNASQQWMRSLQTILGSRDPVVYNTTTRPPVEMQNHLHDGRYHRPRSSNRFGTSRHSATVGLAESAVFSQLGRLQWG